MEKEKSEEELKKELITKIKELLEIVKRLLKIKNNTVEINDLIDKNFENEDINALEKIKYLLTEIIKKLKSRPRPTIKPQEKSKKKSIK